MQGFMPSKDDIFSKVQGATKTGRVCDELESFSSLKSQRFKHMEDLLANIIILILNKFYKQ